jgi:hypothetical protein
LKHVVQTLEPKGAPEVAQSARDRGTAEFYLTGRYTIAIGARPHSVHAYALFHVFHRQAPRDGLKTAFVIIGTAEFTPAIG